MKALGHKPDHVDAAKRYAAANKSDPFAFNRAMSHLKSGICSYDKDGMPIRYDAEEGKETREVTVNGVKHTYEATVFRNIVRP